MTVLQVTFQPFGILNALRERFVIPFALTALLRIVLFAPKHTFVYQTFGASSMWARWTHLALFHLLALGRIRNDSTLTTTQICPRRLADHHACVGNCAVQRDLLRLDRDRRIWRLTVCVRLAPLA